jgi:hypothetical protein
MGGQIDPPPQHILVFKYPSRDRVKNLKYYGSNEPGKKNPPQAHSMNCQAKLPKMIILGLRTFEIKKLITCSKR